MKQVISYSLYGTDTRYTENALINATKMLEIYPEWIMRVYYDNTVPKNIIDKLTEQKHVELINMENKNITCSGLDKEECKPPCVYVSGEKRSYCRKKRSKTIKRKSGEKQAKIRKSKKSKLLKKKVKHGIDKKEEVKDDDKKDDEIGSRELKNFDYKCDLYSSDNLKKYGYMRTDVNCARWQVSLSKSARTRCRCCGISIPKGQTIVADTMYMTDKHDGGYLSGYYCVDCIFN